MTRRLQPALTVFAAGMIGLGVLGLIYGDFALVWQPVSPWVPGRTALAYLAGAFMLAGGTGLLFRAASAWSARILFPYFIIWWLLKVPALVVAPRMEAVWLGSGEIAVLLAGGWVLFARLSDLQKGRIATWMTGENGVHCARILFGVALIPIGLSHLVYPQETVTFVPAWLPFRLGLAYLTGAGQMACGIAVLLRIYPRVAAMVETGMLGSFALLVWGPAIFAHPTQRLPWTAFFITWAIMASAWVIASDMPGGRRGRLADATSPLLNDPPHLR